MVTIQARSDVDTVDPDGFPTDVWTTLRVAYMSKSEMSTLRGQEHFTAGQLSAPTITKWQMDYVPDMDPDLVDVAKLRRLVYRSRAYDITDAHVMGMRRGVEFTTVTANRVVA
jgi:hypothetical protein